MTGTARHNPEYSMSAAELSAALSNSLSLGSILILTALGLAITFGVMRVINMAHGEMLMLGAYTALVVTSDDWLNLNLFVAIPAAFVVVGFIGYLLEVSLIRFLYGRPLDTLLATWGVGMIIQNVVKQAFGANLQTLRTPEMLQGGWTVGDVTIPTYRVFIVVITAAALLGVYVLFFRTSFGLKVRAVVQNRQMAAALGISTRRIDSLTFAFASGLAGVAGCILAHLYNIKYTMGADYIVSAFMVVILGGAGSLTGSAAGGALVGTGDSLVSKALAGSTLQSFAVSLGIDPETYSRLVGQNSESMAKVLMLLLVIVFILIRPSGLFAPRERSYD